MHVCCYYDTVTKHNDSYTTTQSTVRHYNTVVISSSNIIIQTAVT